MKPIIPALVGPTGVGKTQTAIALCRPLNAEIVTMDSMQVYRRMDIGTAKPTSQERQAAVHHMLDVVEPDALLTVSMYRDMAVRVIEDILRRGKLPLLAGGTGLYLNALRYTMQLGTNGADDVLRERLRAIAAEEGGAERLHAMLAAVDPESAAALHPNDTRRVMRALEIYETTGVKKSEQQQTQEEGPYHILVYALTMPRDQMYARINARVDAMMDAGLVDEVCALLAEGVAPSQAGGAMQAIGYKEIVAALRGEISMERAVALIKQGSRRYAKRQWTWFRGDPQTRWFDVTQYPDARALQDALCAQIMADMEAYRRAQTREDEARMDSP